MDIDLLSKMIKELILDHDRVSLPGLGTFVAETVPASFTDKGYTINPPFRRMSFRPGQEDDGLLSSLYASVNDVDEDVARVAMRDFVAGMKEVLEKKKTVVFPGLGRLRATKENNFFFVSDENLEIYPEGFGLEPVSLKTHDETKEELSAALGSLKNIMETPGAPCEAAPEAGMETGLAEPEDPAAGEKADDGMEGEVTAEELEDMPLLVEPESGSSLSEEQVPVPLSGEVVVPAVKESSWLDSYLAEERRKRKIMLYVLVGVGAVILLLVLFMIVSRVFPDFIDLLLYNKEDYEILHNISLFQN